MIERQKLTPPQLARIWGVSTNKIIGFIRRGELRCVDLSSHGSSRPRYAIDLVDIEAFEKARQVVPEGGENATRKLRRRTAKHVKEFF